MIFHFCSSGACFAIVFICVYITHRSHNLRTECQDDHRSCVLAFLNSLTTVSIWGFPSVHISFYPFRIMSILKYFSVPIIFFSLLFLLTATIRSAPLILSHNEMYLYCECPWGLLWFRRPSKHATLSANSCNVSSSAFFPSTISVLEILCNILLRLALLHSAQLANK